MRLDEEANQLTLAKDNKWKDDEAKEVPISSFSKKSDTIRRKTYKTAGGDELCGAASVSSDFNNNDEDVNKSGGNCRSVAQYVGANNSGDSDVNGKILDSSDIQWDVIKQILSSSVLNPGSSVENDDSRCSSSSNSSTLSSSSSSSASNNTPTEPKASTSFAGVVSLVYDVESAKARLELSKNHSERGSLVS